MPENQPLRFSAEDRSIIIKHAIGKPTGVVVELGGVKIDLVPLTTAQADEVFAVVGVFADLYTKATGDGDVTMNQAEALNLATKEVRHVRQLVRDVLHESALANDLIVGDEGEAIFDEWFAHLSASKDNFEPVVNKVIEASGLKTILGNLLTPQVGATTTAGESPST